MSAPVDLDELRQRFAADMRAGVRELAAIGYDAKLFARMLADHGAEKAARLLVSAKVPSYGLWQLKKLDRLDMSVEMWILLPWYEPLFDADLRDQAREKLELLGVDVPSELARLVRRIDPV